MKQHVIVVEEQGKARELQRLLERIVDRPAAAAAAAVRCLPSIREGGDCLGCFDGRRRRRALRAAGRGGRPLDP